MCRITQTLLLFSVCILIFLCCFLFREYEKIVFIETWAIQIEYMFELFKCTSHRRLSLKSKNEKVFYVHFYCILPPLLSSLIQSIFNSICGLGTIKLFFENNVIPSYFFFLFITWVHTSLYWSTLKIQKLSYLVVVIWIKA